jgi:subtilisin family serine protease
VGGPPSPWAAVAAVFVGLWAVAVTVGAQGVGWLIDQVLLGAGLARPARLWPLTAAVDALLVGLPAGLLAALPRSPAVRTAGRAWLLGAATLGAFGPLRAIPMPHHELYLAALAGSAALVAVVFRRLQGRGLRGRPLRGHRLRAFGLRWRGLATEPAAVGLAVSGGLALLLPWLWFGALGGLLETVLALTAAAAIGWLAATILDRRFWTAYERRADGEPAGAPRLVILGGLVAGVALMLLAAGVGQSGAQLAAMLVLPPAGFAVAALQPMSRLASRGFTSYRSSPDAGPSGAVGWLVAIATAGPLAFVDPEEISLLLVNGRDVPFWAAVAAGSSLAVALLLGIGYGIPFARANAPIPRRSVAAVAAAAVLLAAGGVYLGLGQPGLYGEKLFVMLKQQADLGGIPAGQPGLAGRDARAREVYRRLVATAETSQAALRRDLDRLHLLYTPYYLVNAIEVDGGPAVRVWLSRHYAVARVLLSQRLRPLPGAPFAPGEDAVSPDGPAAPTVPQWNLTMIGADRVWSQLGVDGSGIVVGASDSGVDGRHPALAGGFRGGDDSWYDPWNGTRVPTDHGGHGTHTLATAVGRNGVGVARGARWVGCVNLDRNLGNPAHYLDCLQFMLAPFTTGGNPFTDGRPERAPQVLTNSWGCPPVEGCDRDALRPATAALAAAGIFVVAAAGNTGPYCGSVEDPPAPYADVMTVGAVDRQGRVTRFSSRGPAPGGVVKPDVVAPGAGVLSAMPGGGYATLDGTSMATPHVAGVVALMWSANQALVGNLDRTRSILRDTAVPADLSSLPDSPSARCGQDANIEGAGLIDAYAAVQAAKRAAG